MATRVFVGTCMLAPAQSVTRKVVVCQSFRFTIKRMSLSFSVQLRLILGDSGGVCMSTGA